MKLWIQKRAFWPTSTSDVDSFVKSCEAFARYHRGSIRHQLPLQTPPIGEPWERVSIDITVQHPRSSSGKQYVLTVVDHFSKWAESISITNHSCQTVAKALTINVVTKYEIPLQILSDRRPEFENELFSNLMKMLGNYKFWASAYWTSTNGTVERFHRTFNQMLGNVITEKQRDWDQKLQFVLAACRTSVRSATVSSPNL